MRKTWIIIGAYVCFSPTAANFARTITGVVAGHLRIEAAETRGIGKIVRKPWMVSNANSNGIFSRDSSTAIRWRSLIR